MEMKMKTTASQVLLLSAACAFPAFAAIDIGGNRQVLWDDYLVDTSKTTARVARHSPERMGTVLKQTGRFGGNNACYYHFVVDEDANGTLYRLYYKSYADAGATPNVAQNYNTADLRICYAESRDGIAWTRPNLGITTFEGSTANNIIVDGTTFDKAEYGNPKLKFDNFFVFKDANPNCSANERYKAIARIIVLDSNGKALDGYYPEQAAADPTFGTAASHNFLWCFVSADGKNFRPGWWVMKPVSWISFDSLNTACWDAAAGCYRLFFRGYHADDRDAYSVRDVRTCTSTDFRSWTTPVICDYGAAGASHLYTNCAQPYPRAPGVWLSMPMRYYDREAEGVCALADYAKLPDYANRSYRYAHASARQGTAVTDAIFAFSRDGGVHFTCPTDAFLRPGPEHHGNWLYGDANIGDPMLVLPSADGSDATLNLYSTDVHYQDEPAELVRYRLRLDGFFSRHADYETPAHVLTKELVYTGGDLFVNLATSAAGSLKVMLRASDGALAVSKEIRGDSADLKVTWDLNSPAALAGKAVTVQFELKDADLYAFRFGSD